MVAMVDAQTNKVTSTGIITHRDATQKKNLTTQQPSAKFDSLVKLQEARETFLSRHLSLETDKKWHQSSDCNN